jgi:hypothetical protein
MEIIDKSKCIILGKYIFPRYKLLSNGDELYAFNTETQTLEIYLGCEMRDFFEREMIANEIVDKMLGAYFDLFIDKFLAENIKDEIEFYEWEKRQIEEWGMTEEFKKMIEYK